MKKSFKTFLFCLVPLLFTSCYPNYNADDPFYKNKNINKELKKKTSMQNFSNIANPVVLFYGISDIQYLPYNKKETRPVQDGTLCFVFDLQNNKVIDYVYSPNMKSQMAQKRGSGPSYNIADEKGYYELSATGGQISYKAFNSNITPVGIIEKENYSPYVVMYDWTKPNSDYNESYYFVDENNPIGTKTTSVSYYGKYYENSFISDVNGKDFYVTEPRLDKFNIYKITPSFSSDIRKTFTSYKTIPNNDGIKHLYKVIGTDSSYVYVADWLDFSSNLYEGNEPNGNDFNLRLHRVNKEGSESQPVYLSMPRIKGEELNVRKLYKVGNDSYIVCTVYSDVDKESYITILKLDSTSSKLSFVKEKVWHEDTCNDIFYNDNLKRIYFFNSAFSGGVRYKYFDIATSTFSKAYRITQEDIENKTIIQ